MFEYITNFLNKEKKHSNKFCYIYGSFAKTAPNFRSENSDIDILCSQNFDKYEIMYILKEKYPNLKDDVKIDMHYTYPDEAGIVYYPISYWQSEGVIPIVKNDNIKAIPRRGIKYLESVIRDPNKDILINYLNTANNIDIYNPLHFYHSTINHYGIDNFINVVDNSNLYLYEKQLLKEIINKKGILNEECNNCKNLELDKNNGKIISHEKTFDYFTFYRKCLGYNYFYSIWYGAYPAIYNIYFGKKN